jgi:hypothetical protein
MSGYSLKEVRIVLETEEGNGIREHPYVAPTAVVVRLTPLAVLIPDAQNLVWDPLRVGALVVSVGVVACNTTRTLQRQLGRHVA